MTFAAFVKQSMLHAYVSDIPSRPLDIAASTLLASESYQGICGKTTDQQCKGIVFDCQIFWNSVV